MVAPWSAPDIAAAAPPAPPGSVPAAAAAPVPRPAVVPANAPLVTHPLTRFAIVDTALDVIKAAPGVILGATAMFLVPFEVVSVALRRNQLGLDDVSTGVTASFLAAVVLRLLTISFVTFAVTHVLWAWQRGEAPRARTAAAAALRRAPGLVLAWVLVHVAEAAALAAFGVPYLIVAPLLLCTVPVMAVEGRSALSAMGRSWRLGLRELGLVLGGFLLIATVGVVLLVALSGVSYATDAIFDALGWSGSFLVDVAVSFATSMVLVPFAAGSVALVYFDLRVRREGLDLELAADRHFDAA